MYQQDLTQSEMIRAEYLKDVELLSKYMNYLEKRAGSSVSSFYEGEADFKVIQIPVYESTMLAFVKDAGKTKFIDKNYRHTYSKYRIKGVEDELRLIKHAHLKDIDLFKAVLSKYILQGRSKGLVWSEGVKNGVFLEWMRRATMLFFATNVE